MQNPLHFTLALQCLGLYNCAVWLPLVCQAGCFSNEAVLAQLPPFSRCPSVAFDVHILNQPCRVIGAPVRRFPP